MTEQKPDTCVLAPGLWEELGVRSGCRAPRVSWHSGVGYQIPVPIFFSLPHYTARLWLMRAVGYISYNSPHRGPASLPHPRPHALMLVDVTTIEIYFSPSFYYSCYLVLCKVAAPAEMFLLSFL